ncbi:hypothetical protein [Hyalangium versicolor]|uniref:hypothetical protein n=1 Tax=Hyalangium versicolor TaxID=2861190 RepID=UPI001CCACE10|nr:hypothetical protein [Hyalangium versicolor]
MATEMNPGTQSSLAHAQDSAAQLPELIQELCAAEPERTARVYPRLVELAWADGRLSGATLPVVPLLVGALESAQPLTVARAALLLGVLAEAPAEHPLAREVREAVRRGVPLALAAARRNMSSRRARLALLFLLAHFPEDRERVLGELEPGGFGPDDFSRLERCLHTADFSAPGRVELIGRGWPSPAFWRVTEEEAAADQQWRRGLGLSAEQLEVYWKEETTAVLALLGAQAEHAIEEGQE